MTTTTRTIITTATDLHVYVGNCHPDFVQHKLGTQLAEAIQADDHPPWGEDWQPWLDANIARIREAVSEPKKRKTITIALSEHSPVKVDPEDWPIIASADEHDGKVAVQANHVWWIKVRQHEDGRRIVYGKLESGPGGVHQGWRGAHAGYLIPPIDATRDHPTNVTMVPDEEATIRAIRRVAGAIDDDKMGDECIADLPAKELV